MTPAPRGNRYAAKARPANRNLNIRVPEAELAAWRQAAHDAGETVSERVRRRMNQDARWAAAPVTLTIGGVVRRAMRQHEKNVTGPVHVIDGNETQPRGLG